MIFTELIDKNPRFYSLLCEFRLNIMRYKLVIECSQNEVYICGIVRITGSLQYTAWEQLHEL